MIIDDIKHYNKMVENHKHLIEVHYQSAYGLNKLSQFVKKAKKEVKEQENNLKQLEKLHDQRIVEYSVIKLANEKLNKLLKNYESIKDECISEKEAFEDSYKNLMDSYNKVKFLYQYITSKTSYKILVKLKKKFKINPVEEPEKYPAKTKYSQKEYESFVNN